ncbi:MAG: response regulator [Candidatus Methanoperedens sp.]|nr:response regulator [Candidatus Methanoperedens sp.]
MENDRYKILVVDDQPMNVKIIEDILKKEYDTIHAYNGREALEKIKSEKPDIVLLDIVMPEIDGLEVCKKIKQESTTRFIPVVIITSLSDLDDKIKAIEAGADEFLTKPTNSIELTTRVKSLLKTKYFHDQLIESKEKIEAQNDFKTIMANIVPLLLQNISPDKKNETLSEMSKQVEEVIWRKYIRDIPNDMKQTASISCSIMNRLGGCYTIEDLNGNGYFMHNEKCPWGEYGSINPVLCMLTKAIFARIGIRVLKDINVDIKKTIAGGDGHCLIEVYAGNY